MMLIRYLVIGVTIWLSGTIVVAQDDTPVTNPVFGVVEGFWFPELTCQLGVGWERIIFDWAQHQPEGPDDWHTLNVDDRWLQAASDCGREVVAIIKNVPAWATDGTPGSGVPRGLDLPVDDPDNIWANFMRRAAEYYASRGVTHFIIMNEPDISSDTYGFEFEGTLEDYYQMLRVAYIAARQGNPSAVIHLAGTTYWHDVNDGQRLFVDRLLERITADPEAPANNYYFNVLSLHLYFRTDSIYDIVQEMRTLLDSYGLTDHTIWINETNAAPTDDPVWPVERPVYQLDLSQQAAFLVQAAALGLAAGAERIAVYKLWDQGLPPGGESFGILYPTDNSPRPAYYAWQTVTRYFAGVTQARIARTDTVDAVEMIHVNGRQTVVAWARTAQSATITITATGSKANVFDQYGNMTVLRPVNGVYTLTLSGAACNEADGSCPVGGAVMMLVQPSGELNVQEVTANSEAITLEFE